MTARVSLCAHRASLGLREPTQCVRQNVTFQRSIATGQYPAMRRSVTAPLMASIDVGWSNSTQIVLGSGP